MTVRLAVMAALMVASTSCSGGDTDQPGATAGGASDAAPVTITVTGFSYPTDIEVPSGAMVTWVNDTDAAHSVLFTAVDATVVDGPLLDLPGRGEVGTTLTDGAWSYICGIHERMSGTLLVGL